MTDEIIQLLENYQRTLHHTYNYWLKWKCEKYSDVWSIPYYDRIRDALKQQVRL